MKRIWTLLVLAIMCVEWVRLTGVVKAVNLKANTVTIENRDGDLFTVPIDFQVKLTDKGGDPKMLKDLQLNQKVTLMRTISEIPKEDTEGMAPPEASQRGK